MPIAQMKAVRSAGDGGDHMRRRFPAPEETAIGERPRDPLRAGSQRGWPRALGAPDAGCRASGDALGSKASLRRGGGGPAAGGTCPAARPELILLGRLARADDVPQGFMGGVGDPDSREIAGPVAA